MPPNPSSSDDKTAFTQPPDAGDARPASSRAGASGPGWTPPTVEALQALLPQYEIVSMLGHGGMGAVYKGKQKSLDRMVAIKILPPGLEDDDVNFTERFKNEARTMAKMMHPGIVAVFDFGETAEGQFYFVMEYVDGTDVAKMIQANVKLPPDHALAITAHVCDALGYAHGNGVIHRDIKPANILINAQGQVKIADFGLAKQDDPSMTGGLTKTGMAMGTPDYVAPEALIMGIHVDGRADLYAVGVMLYQMLTGEIPRGLFLMPSVKTNGEIDPRFDKIVTRAMQSNRESRYQKASDIRKDLDVILTTPRVKADASAVAAVPRGAVKNVPGQRSAAQKPLPRSVQPGAKAVAGVSDPGQEGQHTPGSMKPGSMSRATAEKSKTFLYLGIVAAVAVIAGAVFMFSRGKSANTVSSGAKPAENQTLVTSSPAPPVKVTETPKSKPAPVSTLTPQEHKPPTTTGREQWVDGLAEWWSKPEAERAGLGSMVKEAGGSRVGQGPVYVGLKLKNVAVRATVLGGGSAAWMLNVRSLNGSYEASLQKDGIGFIRLHDSVKRKTTELANFALPAGFLLADRHTAEFRAEGDVLTFIIDGKVVATARDSTRNTGNVSFKGEGALIEKIEYLDLGVDPPAAD